MLNKINNKFLSIILMNEFDEKRNEDKHFILLNCMSNQHHNPDAIKFPFASSSEIYDL